MTHHLTLLPNADTRHQALRGLYPSVRAACISTPAITTTTVSTYLAATQLAYFRGAGWHREWTTYGSIIIMHTLNAATHAMTGGDIITCNGGAGLQLANGSSQSTLLQHTRMRNV